MSSLPRYMGENVMLEASVDAGPVIEPHGDDALPFRLGDIKLGFQTAKWHPKLASVDRVLHELTFQFKLMFAEWKLEHWMALATGVLAFSLGVFSGETFSGGDAKVSGMDGLSTVGGFGFFQIMLSIVLWLWFMMQATMIMPIMRGHLINLMIVWASLMGAQMLFHVSSPNFPFEFSTGDMLGGIVLMAIAIFFSYFFWKAVTETRDLHVQEHHLDDDVRVMEIAVKEHSLRGWGVLLITWLVIININAWSGAHFIADRMADRTGTLALHAISGFAGIFFLLAMLWYPQRMLGKETIVRTKAATRTLEGEIETTAVSEKAGHSSGMCPSCTTPIQAQRSIEGEILLNCEKDGCDGNGVPGQKCQSCNKKLPSRVTCASCGLNASVLDFFPNVEAW